MAEHVMALRAMTCLILYCQIIPMFHNFNIQQDDFKVETKHDHDKGACHESPFRDVDFDCCVFVFTGCYATKMQDCGACTLMFAHCFVKYKQLLTTMVMIIFSHSNTPL